MDNYLESLVLKREKSTEIEDSAREVAESATTNVEQEVGAPNSELEECIDVKEVEAGPVVESDVAEPKDEPENDTTSESESAASEVSVAEIATTVKDIKIFNTPDRKGPFKIFSGNVVIKDKVDTMTLIEYVKPGFGLVKGFTPNL